MLLAGKTMELPNRTELAGLTDAGRTWTADEARSVLAAWRASGLSICGFARKHGLTAQRLSWWRRRLGAWEEEVVTDGVDAVERGSLVPVVVSTMESGQAGGTGVVSIQLRGGTSIVISEPSAVEPQWVARLVSELERTCC
jgi:transposase-like protein